MAIEKVLSDNNVYHNFIPSLNEAMVDRFWAKVAIASSPKTCWDWKAGLSTKKYGIFCVGGRGFAAHRVSYFLNHKKDPMELSVLHSCDNPTCVNPNHLFLGTNMDNVQDKVRKGRQARNIAWNKGKETVYRLWDNPNCKPDKEDFFNMKLLYDKGGVSISSLANKYGTSKKAVSCAIRKIGGVVPTHFTVLTKDQVLEIRDKYIPERGNINKLSKEYSIGAKTISDIVRRITWKNI